MDELLEYKKNSILGNVGGQPLCQDFKSAWRKCGTDKEMLVRLALSQQAIPHLSTACYKNLGLTKGYILSNFSEYINGKRTFDGVDGVDGFSTQLYVGFGEDFDVSSDVTSLMWCDCCVTIPKTKCSRIYVSNSSCVHLTLDGYSSPVIYLFDESRVVIDDCDDTCDVTVLRYGKDAVVEHGKYCLGTVKTFDKKLVL